MGMGLDEALSILGIEHGTKEREIEKKYRKLSFEVHPDRHPGDKECAEKFKKLSEAHSVIKEAVRNGWMEKRPGVSQNASPFNPSHQGRSYVNKTIFDLFFNCFMAGSDPGIDKLHRDAFKRAMSNMFGKDPDEDG
jgi:DnaJ-class molecular chaperone